MSRRRIIVGSGVLLVLVALTLGLSRSRVARALTKSTAGFVRHDRDTRVLYEPGAERWAEAIADYLSTAILLVERAHGLPFAKEVEVVVCASQESLNEFVAAPESSPLRGTAVLGRVFIAPSAFDWGGRDTHRASLTHELSHLHISQRVGYLSRRTRIPSWFHEGLANSIADSGGEGISVVAAAAAIREGHHFEPRASGTLIGPRLPSEWGISYPMHHRQSEMFVSHLREKDPEAFESLLRVLQEESRFAEPFEYHFNGTPADAWRDFLATLPGGG